MALVAGARLAALWVALVTACQAALEIGVKDAVARPRPAYGHPVTTATGWSFPSGHAMTAATVLTLFALLLLPHARGRTARWALLGAAALLVLLVSWSRLALAVHWPSDVLGAWLLARALLGAVTAAFDFVRPGRRAAETAALHLRSSRRVQPDRAEDGSRTTAD
ncbi:phosphatase PAP2 family protein [Streptacidiphilus monticola]